jgi:HCOMODA/2-hydroxy-3-carboxy-muconic semialdehyde decarboxylase
MSRITSDEATLKHVEDLVAANRVLADHGVLDGYGHVSVRSPQRPDRYLLARSIAPASVTADDIMEYDLDSNPVDQRGRAMYLERFIHGEIYRARPDVQAVVHNHSPSVIPFGVTSVPLRPLYHMSAFVGEGIPVFEIREVGGPATNLLVRDRPLGQALARTLGGKPAALMRGHGCVVVADNLPLAVGRSVYLEINARLQVQAIILAGPGGSVTYLEPGEVKAASAVNDYKRAWDMWRATVLAR